MKKNFKKWLINNVSKSFDIIFFVLPFTIVLGFYSSESYSAKDSTKESREIFLEKKEQFLEKRESNWILSQKAQIEQQAMEQKDIARVQKILTNDKEYLKQVGSRSYRNNNPGNLRFVGQIGAIGADENGFAIFESYEAGKQAHLRQIELDANRGHTLESFLSKFAPGTSNFPSHYLGYLLQKFPEATPETPLSELDMEAVQKRMQQVEGWIEPREKKEATAIENEVPIITNDPRKIELKLKASGCNEVEDVKERVECMRKTSFL